MVNGEGGVGVSERWCEGNYQRKESEIIFSGKKNIVAGNKIVMLAEEHDGKDGCGCSRW